MPAKKKVAKYSKKYSKFVMGLATSPDKMEKVWADPLGAMKKTGLTQEEMSIISSGKTGAILARVNPASYREIETFIVCVRAPVVTPLVQPNIVWAAIPKRKRK